MSAPTIPSVADLLRGALAELRRPLNPVTGHGWTQGKYGTGNDCKCADGAIIQAVLDGLRAGRPTQMADVIDDLRLQLAKVISDVQGWEAPGREVRGLRLAKLIHHWNDNRERVFPEVEAVFERAIELAEAGTR
ncbi:hypothetical protein PROPHIGD91-3_6 [Mycobacterium phage prophi91-3]|uniref:DUF6197 family protein n=1 Tax=Mycobacteroides abscessus TaxID=36809 RepID=UPI0019D07D85|nr:hypothetical protein [Mycobacteroides abscessus]QSM88764.1 hypothetical protein I3U44_24000 [Mycobacteroides abscessus subsp. bolletii]QST90009.1 hypothetical protein PROPHIGD91-3_6 [Mycobacterium phage prophi91-3]